MFTGFVAIFYLSNCQRWDYTIASYFCEYSFSSPVIHLYLYFHTFRNEFFKFFSLYKFFRTYVKHKRTSRFFQKTTYSVLSDITVFCCLFNCKSHFFTYRNMLFAHKILPLLFNAHSIHFYPQYTRSFFVFNNVFAFSIFILAIASRLLVPPTYIGVHISKIRS